VKESLFTFSGVLALSVFGTAAGLSMVNGLEQIGAGVAGYLTRQPIEAELPPIDLVVSSYKEIIFPFTLAYGLMFSSIVGVKTALLNLQNNADCSIIGQYERKRYNSS